MLHNALQEINYLLNFITNLDKNQYLFPFELTPTTPPTAAQIKVIISFVKKLNEIEFLAKITPAKKITQ
jgi:hypothetical protein